MNSNELNQLVRANVITEETAGRIRAYYEQRKGDQRLTLFSVFAIIASLLISLGIILIIAHNWDELAKSLKVTLAFVPLLVAQALCLYVLLSGKLQLHAWREGSATFLYFALGACIALISQIYHVDGSLDEFLFTWMWLCLPVIYLMNSSVVSLLYLAGITWYAVEAGYWSAADHPDVWYWLMLLPALPHYYALLSKCPRSNFTIYHNWIIPISLTIALGTLSDRHPELMYIAYMSLFAVFYLAGRHLSAVYDKLRNNAPMIVGSLGTVVLLLTLSFEEFWSKLSSKNFPFPSVLTSGEFTASVIFTGIAAFILYRLRRLQPGTARPLDLVFAAFIIAFLAGTLSAMAVILINIILVLVGMMTMREGVRADKLGTLNFGVLIISALIACRFFDADISFVLRGVLFIALGIAIFILNTWMLRKRRT